MKHSGVKKRPTRKKREALLLGNLLFKNPILLEVLRRHEVAFCAGCYLTLFATPERAAAYHGVRDIPRFLKELSTARASRSRLP